MANPGIFLDVQAEAKSLGTFKKQLLELVKEPLKVKIDIDKDSISKFQKQIKDLTDAADKAGKGYTTKGANDALAKQTARLMEIEALQKRIAEQVRKASGFTGLASSESVKALEDAYETLSVLALVVKDNDEAVKKYGATISDVRSKLSSATTIIKDFTTAEEQAASASEKETKAIDARERSHAAELKQLSEIEAVRKRVNALLQKSADYGIDSAAVDSTKRMAGELDNLQVGTKNFASSMAEIKLHLTENENSINRAIRTTKALSQAEKEEAQAAKESANASKEDTSAKNKQVNALSTVENGIKSLVSRYLSFAAIARVMRDMAQASIELDSAFTQLRIVTGATESEMAKFEQTTYKLSKNLGQNATDVAKSIEVFSRLGYGLDDASKLAEYAGVLSNVANVSGDEATTGLTSIIKGFNMQVSDAEHVSDVLIQVGQKYAVSAGEIMTAFEKSSAALNATGVSFEKAAGLIAAANASVQDASTVGTALKTVSARVRSSEADLKELGEDAEDLAEGFSKYAAEIKQLTGVNIMVEGTTDTFRDLYDIMADISKVWNTLTHTQQARVSEILGGKRQLQVISSILGNWKDAVGAYEDAMNSAGVAVQANATYMESAQAHINQFKTTFQELSATVVQSGMISSLTDIGTKILEVSTNFVKFVSAGEKVKYIIDGLIVVIAALAAKWAMLSVSKNASTWATAIGAGLDKLKSGLLTVTHAFPDAINAMKMYRDGAISGANALQVMTPAVTILAAAVAAGIMIWRHYREEQEKAAQAIRDNAKAAADFTDDVDSLLKEYTALADAESLTADERDRLAELTEELIEKYDIERSRIVELTGEYGNYKDAIHAAIAEKQHEKNLEMEAGLVQASKDVTSLAGNGLVSVGPRYRDLTSKQAFSNGSDQVSEAIAALRDAGMISGSMGQLVNGGIDLFPDLDLNQIEDAVEAHERLGKMMLVVKDAAGAENGVYTTLAAKYGELTGVVNTYKDTISSLNKGYAIEYIERALSENDMPRTTQEFEDFRNKLVATALASDNFRGSNEEVAASIDDVLSRQAAFSDFYETGKTGFAQMKTGADDLKQSLTDLSGLSDVLSKLKEKYDILWKAEKETKDGGGLSPDTIKAMSSATDDYLDYLYEENGLIKLNTEAWNEFIAAQKQEATSEIRQNIELLKQQRIEIQQNINDLSATSSPYDEAAQARLAELKQQLEQNGAAIAAGVASLDVYNAAMSTVATTTEEAADKTKTLSGFLTETSSNLTSLADLQAAVSDSYRISVSEAMKYADIFPEILAQSQLTADGQIQLNQAVVDSFIQSSQAEINAAIEKKIAELEAEKEVLEAKKAFAEAKLQIVKAAGEAEGDVAYQTAQYRLQVADELVAKLIEEGNEESEAYAQVAESMATNIEEFDSVVAEVADDMQHNLGEAADNAATSISNNMSNASESVRTLGKQIHEAARQMNALRNGQLVEYTDTGTSGAGGAGYHTSNMRVKSHSFKGTVVSKSKKDLALDTLTIDLENTISGYEGEIAKIDGSIANLRNILNSSLDKFASGGGSGKSGSGGGGGGKSGGSTSADVQKVDQEVIKGYESLISQYQKAIQVTQSYLDQAIATNDIAGVQEHTQKIIDYYRQMQETVHDEAEYYRSLGYDETSDEIQKLKDLWWDYAENIGTVTAEAYQKLADNAKSSLDEIRSAYDTLKSAAQEYAESGFITINTLESIISMGVQYLGFLYDENGQLVINEQSIQRVIAARTEQYAVESALAYVAQVRQAAEAGDIATLNQLTQATQISTGATWDLVYAQMALINLSDEQYNGMLRNVQAMQSLTASAVSSIGQQTGQIRRQYEEEQAGLNKIMDATKAMIRQENQAQINATKESYQAQINAAKEAGNAQVEMLRNQKKAYDDQIEQKKKLLDQTQKQIDKEDTLAEKVQKIAKLQAKITQLSLDDSREAKAERTKLEEELANLQKDLADTQRQYEVDAQKEALDAEKQAYDNAMDAQISAAQKAADAAVSAMQASMDQQVSILQNSLNSEEKLYQAALARIDGGWDSLYGDLKAWNSEYGNMVESDLVSAWDAASAAVQRYGSYAAAVTGIQNDLNNMSNSNVIGTTAGTSGSSSINTASIQGIMTQMRRNSNSWGAASQAERDRLHTENAQLAQNLARFGVKVRYDGPTGTWIIESDSNNPQNVGRKLYDVYHSGGIVGKAPTLQYNETIAKLKNGEVVLTEGQGKALYKIVDFMSVLADKLGHSIDSSMIGRLFGNTGTFTSTATSAMGRGIAALMGGGSGNIHVEHLDVTAPIHVVQKLDDEEIREHARTIGSFAAEYIKEGFVKRGVKATAALF